MLRSVRDGALLLVVHLALRFALLFGVNKVSEAGKRVFRTLKAGDAGGGRAGGAGAGGSANSGMSMKQGWDGREVGMPYPVSLPFEDKRLLAQVRSAVRVQEGA